MKRIGFGIAAVLMTAGLGFAAEPAMTTKTPNGNIYTDAKGMTLYTFDKDKAGKSNLLRRLCSQLAGSQGRRRRKGDWRMDGRGPHRRHQDVGV